MVVSSMAPFDFFSHRFDADLEMESNCEKLGADRALFAITTDRLGGAYTK